MYRKTYASINTDILSKNIKNIISNYNYKYYIGVVKANAYGHGDYIINTMIKSGINYLAVSSLEEAISIRKYNKDIPILCLEPISLDYIDDVINNNITLTVSTYEYISKLSKINKKVNIHLKIDTGMNRLGFKIKEDIDNSIDLINKNNNIFLEGIYSHLATSGINDKYYDKGIDKFLELTKDINLENIPIVHLDRSITLVHHKKLSFVNGVRLGIIMYGFSQSLLEPTGIRKIKRNLLLKFKGISPSIMKNDLQLKTLFTLYTEVMEVKDVKKGEYVGYSASYIANKDIRIAIIPIGYVDGIRKEMKYVSINNHRYEIIGEVCMDMTMIKIDNSVNIHDKVEIFGNNISIKEVTSRLNTNAYHLFTSISTRVPRVYDDKLEIKY